MIVYLPETPGGKSFGREEYQIPVESGEKERKGEGKWTMALDNLPI